MRLRKLIYHGALLLLISAGVASCKKDFFNINQNPNNATDSTIAYNVILPSALNNTGRWIARDWGWLQNYLGYWARSGTYAPNVAEETYDITTSFQANIWSDIYDNNYDYQVMQNKAAVANATFYEGIARIMRAHNYMILVDVYNNVPYSEALKGNANITPKYDNGADIYKDLFTQLTTGISLVKNADMSTTGPNKAIATDDIMFKGDKTKWAKFANTLKLRAIIHLSRGGVLSPATTAPGFNIPGEIATITAEGSGFLSVGENAEVNPGYTTDKPNPFYNLYVANEAGTATQNSVYYKANAWGLDYYAYNGDPREGRFYTAGTNGFVGVAYGLPPKTENAAANLAGIGAGVAKTSSSSQWILTGTESLFLQAEAIARGYLTGNANSTMRAAITESFTMLGLTAAQANTYMTNNAGYPDVDYTAPAYVTGQAAGGIFTIISQKWFALNAIAPFEVWTDYRRVNYSATVDHFVYGAAVAYPAGPPISVAPQNTATQIPTRLLYPQAEYNYNAANVSSQGTVGKYGKIFWDN